VCVCGLCDVCGCVCGFVCVWFVRCVYVNVCGCGVCVCVWFV